MTTTLQERIEERILTLEFEREAISGKIAELRLLLSDDEDLEPDPGNDLPPAKPRKAKPAAPSANRNGNRKRGATRSRILKLLASGPLKTGEIAEKLDIAIQTIPQNCAGHEWFEKVDPSNRLSPWQLTEAGTAALATAS